MSTENTSLPTSDQITEARTIRELSAAVAKIANYLNNKTMSDPSVPEDVWNALVTALVSTRTQGAWIKAQELSDQYLGGRDVGEIATDKVTPSSALHSATRSSQ